MKKDIGEDADEERDVDVERDLGGVITSKVSKVMVDILETQTR